MRLFNQLSRLRRGSFFMFSLCCFLPVLLEGQFKFREAPGRQDPSPLSGSEPDAVWEAFHEGRQMGSFSIEGRLVHRPAGASSESYDFTLEGDWGADYEHTRIRLLDGSGTARSKAVLTRSGRTWILDGEGNKKKEITEARWGEAIFEELPLTWMDLLMPYLRSERASYLGPDRFLGRPAHRFEIERADGDGFPKRAVVTLDEDYAALLQTDLLDEAGFRRKRMRIGGFRKFGEDWMASELVWENRRERSSIKLNVYSFLNTR
ncbi:MAG: hypothetical protein R6V45_02960 [Oceanipulchritudo sp.]